MQIILKFNITNITTHDSKIFSWNTLSAEYAIVWY